MAQFKKDTHQYLGDGKTIFEVVMLADQYGNLVGAANGDDCLASIDWEELT